MHFSYPAHSLLSCMHVLCRSCGFESCAVRRRDMFHAWMYDGDTDKHGPLTCRSSYASAPCLRTSASAPSAPILPLPPLPFWHSLGVWLDIEAIVTTTPSFVMYARAMQELSLRVMRDALVPGRWPHGGLFDGQPYAARAKQRRRRQRCFSSGMRHGDGGRCCYQHLARICLRMAPWIASSRWPS